MALQRLMREKATALLLDYRLEPVLRVKPGERFVIECEDALQGGIRTGLLCAERQPPGNWARSTPSP